MFRRGFVDRCDAGRRLATVLEQSYPALANAVVVGLPRGGVPLARIVAGGLGCPLDIVVPRKIGHPANPEYAIGAVTEAGTVVWNERERRYCDAMVLSSIVAEQRAEAARRLKRFRPDMPPRNFVGKTIILVDDGAATGYTMSAAIATARAMKARKVIVALPVAPPDTVDRLRKEADEVVVLMQPEPFGAVGAFYASFPQVEDEEVVEIMREWGH